MQMFYLSKTAILLELVNIFNPGATREVNIDRSVGVEVANDYKIVGQKNQMNISEKI